MVRGVLVAGLSVSLLLPTLAANAQGGAAAPDLPKVTQEIRDAQEDLILVRALAALKLTATQLRQLLPTLQMAQDKLKAQDAADATKLKAHQAALEAALKQALAGSQVPAKAEENYRQSLQSIQTARAKLRTDLVASIRTVLKRVLSQQQQAMMAAAGQDMAWFERAMSWQAQAASGQGQGPLGFMTGTLDRIRDVPPAEWDRTKEQYAQRFGGGGFGRGGPGGGPGGGGPGGDGPGGNAPPQDPQRQAQAQARMAQFLQVAEQVRGMPPDQYAAQRFNLASQLMRNMGRGGPGGNEDPEVAISRFIERYLLSSRIVAVAREKSGAGG
jgi:hypothetical protein